MSKLGVIWLVYSYYNQSVVVWWTIMTSIDVHYHSGPFSQPNHGNKRPHLQDRALRRKECIKQLQPRVIPQPNHGSTCPHLPDRA